MFKAISLSLHAVTLAGLAYFITLQAPQRSAVDQEARNVIGTLVGTQRMQIDINKNTQTSLTNEMRSINYIHQTLASQCRINNRLMHINVECGQ